MRVPAKGKMSSIIVPTQTVVNSVNLFIDTRQLDEANGEKGDDMTLQLGQESLEAGDGQMLRLTMTEFSMYNVLHMVNDNNYKFAVTTTTSAGATESKVGFIKRQNYYTPPQIAIAFFNALDEVIASKNGDIHAAAIGTDPTTQSIVLPSTASFASASDRLISLSMLYDTVTVTDVKIRCFQDDGESYLLLGGNRVEGSFPTTSPPAIPATTSESLKVTMNVDSSAGKTTILVEGLYPLQMSTEQSVYVRCQSQTSNIEQRILSGSSTIKSDVTTSSILAKIPINNEFITFTSSTNKEFFVNIPQKKLTSLNLRLTDSRNRSLGRLEADKSKLTAAGLLAATSGVLDSEATFQSTKGNLSFTATVRADIVQIYDPNQLKTPPIPQPMPVLHNRGTLIWENDGNPRM